MIMIRLQVKDILSQLSDSNLGSVIYANSFLAIDDQHCFINITEGVPNLLNWFTNINHHEHLCQEVNTQKNLECDQLGEKLRNVGAAYSDVRGILPVQPEFSDVFEDVVLNGKMVFY
jgi:hypothetical protein